MKTISPIETKAKDINDTFNEIQALELVERWLFEWDRWLQTNILEHKKAKIEQLKQQIEEIQTEIKGITDNLIK